MLRKNPRATFAPNDIKKSISDKNKKRTVNYKQSNRNICTCIYTLKGHEVFKSKLSEGSSKMGEAGQLIS